MDSSTRNAFVYATIVALGGLLFGLDAALISGAVDLISAEFALDDIQIGTAVAAPALGVLIALPFAGFICNRFGRKKAIMLVALLYIVSAVASALAPNYWTLVAARFLGGLAFSSITLASMYIGEIAPPAWRGKLVSMTQINIVLGLSGAYFINYLIYHWAKSDAAWVAQLGIDEYTWRWMLGSEIPFALVWLGLLAIIPESPSWLMYRGREEEAKQALQKILPSDAIAHHVNEMRESIRLSSNDHSVLSEFAELFSKPMRLTVIIAATIAIAQQSSGINAILFYAQTIFKQLGVGTDAAFQSAIWIGLTSVVFTVLGLLLVDKLGRRPLIIGGMIWIIASLGLCSYLFYEARYILSSDAIDRLSQTGAVEGSDVVAPVVPDAARLNPLVDQEFESDLAFKAALQDALGEQDARAFQAALIENSIQLNATMILVGILSFIAAFHISIGPVMWVLFSEIFPITVRGTAIPFFAIVTSLTNWLVQQFFPWQMENLGMSSTLLFYASTVAVGLVILSFTLIETKNMSIEEVQLALAPNLNPTQSETKTAQPESGTDE